MSTQTATSCPTSGVSVRTIADSSTNNRRSDVQFATTDNKNRDGDQDNRTQKTSELDLSQQPAERKPPCCSGMCFSDYVSYFLANFVLTLGMVTFMALYILVGAYVFLSIEQDAEVKILSQEREKHIGMENDVTNRLILWMTHGGGCNTSREDMESEVRNVLHAYTEGVWKNQWRGQVSDKAEIGVENLKWQLLPAYIFCMSIVSTIGYGNLVPKTSLGQIVTIIYAIIGIPCTAVCLSKFGSMAGTFVKFTLYKTRTCRGNNSADEPAMDDDNAGDTPLSGAGQKHITFSDSNNQTNNSVKFPRFSMLSTSLPAKSRSSQQDPDDRSEEGSSNSGSQLALSSFKTTPSATVTLYPAQEDDAPREDTRAIPARKKSRGTSLTSILSKKRLKRRISRTSLAMVTSIIDVDCADRDAVEDVEVPVYVSVVLLIAYVLIGGVIFSEWKGQRWDFLTGFYFSFITLSTIGFGDYVFGDHTSGGDQVGEMLNSAELIFTGFYIFFGLGLVSMCIDLMHKSISRTLTAINLGFWARMYRCSKENKHRQRELRRLRAKLEDAKRTRKTGNTRRVSDRRNSNIDLLKKRSESSIIELKRVFLGELN